MKKTIFWCTLGLLFLVGNVQAQIWKEYSSFYPSVGVQLGTSGIGVQGNYPINEAFNARIGLNFFPGTVANVRNKVFKVERSNVEVMADWQPLYGRSDWFARKWIVSAGAGYFFNNSFVRYVGSRKVPDQDIDYKVTFSKFNPYVGTGLNGIKIAYHVNMNMNIGYFFPVKSREIVPYARDPEGIGYLEDRVGDFPYNVLPGLQAQIGFSYIFF